MSKLQGLLDNLDIIQKSYSEDACLIVTNMEEVIAYRPGKKLDMQIKLGTELASLEGTVTWKAWQHKKVYMEDRGPERFGFSYTSNAQPIFEEGQLVGIFTVVTSNDKADSLVQGATQLAESIHQLAAASNQINQASEEMTTRLQQLTNESDIAAANITNIFSVLRMVHDIATQSHLLGLNAAIEAARAGEHGRGFSIVANEIRKMAENSKQSVADIQAQLNTIQNSMKQISSSVAEFAAITEEHVASIEEMDAALAQIDQTAEFLKQAAISEQ
ncbi:MAG TPA: methyl-accepting chemotaxis protein [Candidatus Bathyarchaeia archaeon]|nr:methyl-accepting chemotaxis protein [Candidatus Bathyarchaeia archaeon]